MDSWSFTEEEFAFIGKHLRPTDRVFEWGSGLSTLFMAHAVAHVTTVEHQAIAAARMILDGARNVSVLFIPPDRPYVEGGEDDGDEITFGHYIDAWQIGRGCDVAVIDGRARVGCARALLDFAGTPRDIFLHDHARQQYAPIHQVMFKEAGVVGRLMRLERR